MALKWKPVALSPQTPQIRGTFLSNSSAATVDVLTTVGSITKKRDEIKGGKGETKRHSKQHCRNCMQQLTHTHTRKKRKERKEKSTRLPNNQLRTRGGAAIQAEAPDLLNSLPGSVRSAQ